MDGNRPAKVSEISPQFKVIIGLAGGSGDRWSGHRKMVGREESPDTVLSHQGKTAHPLSADEGKWATRLVTPGERFGWHRLQPVSADSLTESATENVPPAARSTV